MQGEQEAVPLPVGLVHLHRAGHAAGRAALRGLPGLGLGRVRPPVQRLDSAPERRRLDAAHHRRHRPAHWRTIEHPRDPAKVVAQLNGKSDGLILDCLTMYVSQLLVTGQSDARIEQQVRRLCHALRRTPYPVIVVTNEVGSGIVPEFPMGRRFRDLAGLANQIAATLADEVYLLVAGIPTLIKKRSSSRRSAHASLVTA
ncbi:MAG: bifunctional adenosylcobinamide kinase/adenosylcobinamide-phosphate guanylyltransferase [Gemmatimonadetes bacterium]|nr:bifunctional adenosylcobinamide kinase/adenosylcobinamide-phosphate guanylyltransferase [Gemmatimonadota bacterium]